MDESAGSFVIAFRGGSSQRVEYHTTAADARYIVAKIRFLLSNMGMAGEP